MAFYLGYSQNITSKMKTHCKCHPRLHPSKAFVTSRHVLIINYESKFIYNTKKHFWATFHAPNKKNAFSFWQAAQGHLSMVQYYGQTGKILKIFSHSSNINMLKPSVLCAGLIGLKSSMLLRAKEEHVEVLV